MSAIARLADEIRAQQGISWFEMSSQSVLVACSGGGDSVAMLHVAVEMFGADFVHCATVNHHLRPKASLEVAFVARTCAALGVPHVALDWHWDGQGNLQAAAREGRKALLAQAAEARNCGAIWLGHTADDQAETVLMRLLRGSGVDGLAGMRAQDGPIQRPMLGISRAKLREALRADGVAWIDDPSNEDLRFERVRVRKLLENLEDADLTRARLTKTAALMRAESEVLNGAVAAFSRRHVSEVGADLVCDLSALRQAPAATRERFLACAVQWFGGAPYKPRHDGLRRWFAQASGGQRSTLSGSVAAREGTQVRLSREVAAIPPALNVQLGESAMVIGWDHRWHLTPPKGATGDYSIRPLGTDIAQIPGWRDTGQPRASLMASPAIWQNDTLISAPLAQPDTLWRSRLSPSFTTFLESR